MFDSIAVAGTEKTKSYSDKAAIVMWLNKFSISDKVLPKYNKSCMDISLSHIFYQF